MEIQTIHTIGKMHLMQGKMGWAKMRIPLRRFVIPSVLFMLKPGLFRSHTSSYQNVCQFSLSDLQGCDCLGYVKYFDAHFTNFTGGIETIENCVCLHEEDHGILWKHQDWRTGLAEVRRSRRLTVSFICTVANYEYGFFWHFYQVTY